MDCSNEYGSLFKIRFSIPKYPHFTGGVEFPIAINVPDLKELIVKTRYTTLIRKSDLLSFWGGHLLYVVYEGYQILNIISPLEGCN